MHVTENRSSNAAIERRNPELSLQLALAAARTAAENGGTHITLLDMSSQTALFDYFLIVTGQSRRQLHAISEEIDHTLEVKMNDKRSSIDGYDQSRWIVLDYGTVVIHLFDAETRDYYSLESLWADARKVDLANDLADWPEALEVPGHQTS
jgi:ribosome-associated protein